ncbi:MAG: hypothetical protein LBU50_06900 [Cellulomonas sp.]|jgi:hypothetical protein|nr:hypothetical protein [Cellulomonas sp.]
MPSETDWYLTIPLHEALLIRAGQHVAEVYRVQRRSTDAREDSFSDTKVSQHAGAAVELLSKALLAREHIAFILKNVDEALPGPRRSEHQHGPLGLGNTIDASIAVKRLALNIDLSDAITQIGLSILRGRNSAVHVGFALTSRNETADLLGVWVHYVQEKSELSSADWLPPETERLQGARFTQFTVELLRKINEAKGLFDKRVRDMSKNGSDVEEGLARIECKPDGSGHEEYSSKCEECPACGRAGLLSTDVEDVEYEYEGPGEYSINPVFSSSFRCQVCCLELDDSQTAVVFDPTWKKRHSRPPV